MSSECKDSTVFIIMIIIYNNNYNKYEYIITTNTKRHYFIKL